MLTVFVQHFEVRPEQFGDLFDRGLFAIDFEGCDLGGDVQEFAGFVDGNHDHAFVGRNDLLRPHLYAFQRCGGIRHREALSLAGEEEPDLVHEIGFDPEFGGEGSADAALPGACYSAYFGDSLAVAVAGGHGLLEDSVGRDHARQPRDRQERFRGSVEGLAHHGLYHHVRRAGVKIIPDYAVETIIDREDDYQRSGSHRHSGGADSGDPADHTPGLAGEQIASGYET